MINFVLDNLTSQVRNMCIGPAHFYTIYLSFAFLFSTVNDA